MKRYRSMSWLVLGLLHGQAAASGAAPAELEVATHTLTNGLKILVHEDRSIPNVALYLFSSTGSGRATSGRARPAFPTSSST